MSRWIRFEEGPRSPSGKTRSWSVVAKHGGVELGAVYWYAPWRKYAFAPSPYETVFEQDCLRDIATFIESRTREHRAGLDAVRAGGGSP